MQQKDDLEKQRENQNKQLGSIGLGLLTQRQVLNDGVNATRQIIKLIQAPNIQVELPHLAELNTLSAAKSLLALKPDDAFDGAIIQNMDIVYSVAEPA